MRYSTISLAIYGTIVTSDIPRPPPQHHAFPFPQIPSVDDMLSGAAWKDATSSSLGGTGPYIPKMLLGKFDSEEERETRRQWLRDKMKGERIRNSLAAIELLKKDGIISEGLFSELESKVEDEDGKFCLSVV